MRLTKLFTKTRKDSPADETAKNAQLLIRAGFIHKEMAGVYSFLPLGWLVLQKIEDIVREEMDKIGQEIFMPSMAPVEAWKATGRLDTVDVLLKAVPANKESENRHGAEFILNSTHEEIVTPIAKEFAQSYKDLPVGIYQIAAKYRNEPRSKSGLLRGREFRMKDLYSFHATTEDLMEYYERSKQAYMNIYDRVGIGQDTIIAAASGGDFTEDYSHEFQTRCGAGEDTIFRIPSTGEAYNQEVAPAKAPAVTSNQTLEPMKEVEGKGIVGVEALAKFLDISIEATTKTMLYTTETGQIIAAAVRGRYTISEEKLAKIVGAQRIVLADETTVKKVTGAEVGYAGILNLPDEVRIVVDESCANRVNFEMGANRTDHHTINVNWGRDLPEPEQYYDIKIAQAGDLYPENNEIYEVFSGSEVGNIFPLHTKFSKALDYTYTDENGRQQPVVMGCYGLGTTRLMGVVVEKFADERGLVWPESIAPYKVYLACLGREDDVKQAADELYDELRQKDISVLYDDRDVRPGEKFADHELIGIPHRVVVSQRNIEKNQYEYSARTGDQKEQLTLDELLVKLG